MDLNALVNSPAALATVALLAVGALWRAHMKSDETNANALAELRGAVAAFAPALAALTVVVADALKRERTRMPDE